MRSQRSVAVVVVAGLCLALGACGEGTAGTQREQRGRSDISDTTQLSNTRTGQGREQPAATPTLPGVRDVALRGQFAYALVPDALMVVSLDQPREPKVVGRAVVSRTPLRLALDGLYAYVACSQGGLQIVKVGDPQNPGVVGSYTPENGGVTAIAVAKGLAVAGLDGGAVAVLDVKDPTQPKELKLISGHGAVRDVTILDQWAYVLGDQLRVVDLSNPAEAKVAGTYATKEHLRAVSRYYTRTVLWADEGLRLLNFSAPSRPLMVAELTTKALQQALGSDRVLATASGETKPASGADGGANAVEVIQPGEPVAAETITTEPTPEAAVSTTDAPGEGVLAAPAEPVDSPLDATPAAATDSTGTPTEASPTAETRTAPLSLEARVVALGTRLYVLSPDDGVYVFEVEEHKRLKPLGRIGGVDKPSCVGATDNLALVGNAAGELIVFDIRNAAEPDRLAMVTAATQEEIQQSAESANSQPKSGKAGEPALPLTPEQRRAMDSTPGPSADRPANAPQSDTPRPLN